MEYSRESGVKIIIISLKQVTCTALTTLPFILNEPQVLTTLPFILNEPQVMLLLNSVLYLFSFIKVFDNVRPF